MNATRGTARPAPDRLLVSVPEAARIMCCSQSHVWQLVLKGELPSVKVGRLRRLVYADLVEWVEARK